MAPLCFLHDERSISASIRQSIHAAIRVFSVEGIGIDREAFRCELAPTFSDLKWDLYDVRRMQLAFLHERLPDNRPEIEAFYPFFFTEQAALTDIAHLLDRLSLQDRRRLHELQPYRRRSMARFVLSRFGSGWRIQREGHSAFVQNTPDYRSAARMFEPMAAEVSGAPAFQAVLHGIARIVQGVQPTLRAFELTVHQVCLIARPGVPADNSPEGIHQDDADYIVSALVVERRNVSGGESRIFSADKQTCLLRMILQEGQGLFQADRGSELWHDVTPIRTTEAIGDVDGVRCTFGFDIRILAT